MRFAIVFTLAAAVVSTSASLVVRQSIPQCYETCTSNADLGNCSESDAGCLCNDASFVKETTQCIEQTCQGADLQASLAIGQKLCAAVGVTLSTSVPASSTASGTASSAASGTASGSASGTGTTPSSSASSSASAPATTSQAASAAAHGPNTFIALAAVGLAVALAL